MIEILGYVASGLVVLSLAMTSVVRLRVISLIGAVLFGIYAALIGAVPIVLVNVAIIVINVYFLWRAFTDEEYFTILEVRPDSLYVAGLVRFYEDDIARFQPSYRLAPNSDQFAVLTLRDMVPAGIFIGEPETPGVMRILLDYVTPAHRDLKAGRFLFDRNPDLFRDHGYTTLVSDGGSASHNRYLERMGFRKERGRYMREF
ncbi:hypothetical protein BMS3Abin02_01739 [bacterium BMS3Abin02]|nr:hypothetical protein BMS3Abin02_01739 [bacterium BMS3Abin02]GBE21139.1 hypothetical protein BMS3Bbin01_00480 [bacterium BMS3Bbin01]HDH26791.1 hypothetical protein [Actinomycetota bacterium]